MTKKKEGIVITAAMKEKFRPKIQAELMEFANEDGLIIINAPEELFQRARKIRLLKAFDFGRESPCGHKSWWFIRLNRNKGYHPPNFEAYRDGTIDIGVDSQS